MPTAVPGRSGPQGLPGIPVPALETLEQRLYDLLAPLREIDLDGDGDDDLPSRKDECKALILCENIAFLIRHNQASYGKHIEPQDISFATKNWAAKTTGNGVVGIGVFANGNGFSHTILRATVGKDDYVVDKLAEVAEQLLLQFFPGM
ncbi:hypothetical protein BU25DRAFT_341731 [Macroventuria anomochaeta]|uniref:Uncharacterized protein n=1 Tax=Macroventuria anomochaeta TaxID=301207 RepID=A0ACB6S0K7_9PLEO|nr:uncharacterized protein BU25DRAFT_341731 [Macroventuria anomochaeta]KAF2627478.1 hypothetical protein BU25DRAFT_341731 [Macroventuria anomochaeta]